MIFQTLAVGPLGVNCYLIGCSATREGIIVDPGEEARRILALVDTLGLKVRTVVNTHGHFDHVGGNAAVLAATGAELLVHEADVPFLQRASASARAYGLISEDSPSPDRFLEDGMALSFGECSLRVLHTPGHTAGGCCLYMEREKKVITGDTLFADSVGRTDLPGGSHETLIASIRSKLLVLPDDVAVHPGHGPSSSIGRERRSNPYLR